MASSSVRHEFFHLFSSSFARWAQLQLEELASALIRRDIENPSHHSALGLSLIADKFRSLRPDSDISNHASPFPAGESRARHFIQPVLQAPYHCGARNVSTRQQLHQALSHQGRPIVTNHVDIHPKNKAFSQNRYCKQMCHQAVGRLPVDRGTINQPGGVFSDLIHRAKSATMGRFLACICLGNLLNTPLRIPDGASQ